MTKKEIVRQIADRIHETQLKTKEIVQLTFDAIVDTLIEDRRIELRNFGVFEVKLRKARKARNPRTDAPVEVPPKFVVTFKPGKEMEERVRNLIPTPEELAALVRKKKPQAAETVPSASTTEEAPPAPTASTTPDANGNGGETDASRKKKPKKAPAV